MNRQLPRDIARPKHQPKVVEEPDAGDQHQLTDEEKRQKVSISKQYYGRDFSMGMQLHFESSTKPTICIGRKSAGFKLV